MPDDTLELSDLVKLCYRRVAVELDDRTRFQPGQIKPKLSAWSGTSEGACPFKVRRALMVKVRMGWEGINRGRVLPRIVNEVCVCESRVTSCVLIRRRSIQYSVFRLTVGSGFSLALSTQLFFVLCHINYSLRFTASSV